MPLRSTSKARIHPSYVHSKRCFSRFKRDGSMLLPYEPTRSPLVENSVSTGPHLENVRLSRGKVNRGERLWNTEHLGQ